MSPINCHELKHLAIHLHSAGQTHLNSRKGENISFLSIGQSFLCMMWKVLVYLSPNRTHSSRYVQKAVLNRSPGFALGPYLIVFVAPSISNFRHAPSPLSSFGEWPAHHFNPMRTAALLLVVSPHLLEPEGESDRPHPIQLSVVS